MQAATWAEMVVGVAAMVEEAMGEEREAVGRLKVGIWARGTMAVA